jgi:hypothetical protein
VIALVQRPRRKMHVATHRAGALVWIAVCGRSILAEGASFSRDQHAGDAAALCLDCKAIAELAEALVTYRLAAARGAA